MQYYIQIVKQLTKVVLAHLKKNPKTYKSLVSLGFPKIKYQTEPIQYS